MTQKYEKSTEKPCSNIYKLEDKALSSLQDPNILVPKEEPPEEDLPCDTYKIENKPMLTLQARDILLQKREPPVEIYLPESYKIKEEVLPNHLHSLTPNKKQPKEHIKPKTRLAYAITETFGVAQYSQTQQCFHLKSGPLDYIRMQVTIHDPPQNDYFLDLHLKRTNNRYSQYPVDRCCRKHEAQEGSYPISGSICDKLSSKQEPIKGILAQSHQNPHTYLRFKTKHLIMKNNEAHAEIRLSFACNDSCADSSSPEFTPNTEKSRDMELVVNLTEEKDPGNNREICSKATKIWLKAIIRHKDLIKKQRRNPKGGQATALHKKKMCNLLYPEGISDDLFVTLIQEKVRQEEISNDNKFKVLEILNIRCPSNK